MTDQKNQLLLSDNIAKISEKTKGVLLSNQTSVKNAVDFGQSLLDTIEAEGMNDELDKQCNDYLVKVKKTLSKIQTDRKPITQLFDQIKKNFTLIESKLDPKKSESIYFKVQTKRNEFAKKKAAEEEERRKQANRKLNIQKEQIEIKSSLKQKIFDAFNGLVMSYKRSMLKCFEEMSIESFVDDCSKISDWPTEFNYSLIKNARLKANPIYLSEDEGNEILEAVKLELLKELDAKFQNAIEDYKQDLLDKAPSKKKELEQLLKANEEEKAELEKKARERKIEEMKRMAEEEEKKKQEDTNKVEAEKNAATTNALFDNELEVSDLGKGNARQSYRIEILNPVGWQLIFQFWFQKEGASTPLDKFPGKKLESLKTYCERYAHNHDELIDSQYIRYVETFKAINKAS